MDTQKRKRDEYESDLVMFMRMGSISILDVIIVKLPDVFTAEILPKLDIEDTLNLAQVNKTYNAAVWSVDGVRSLVTKMRPIKGVHRMKNHVMTYESGPILDPMYHAAENGNLPAARALLESGVDVDKTYDYDEDEDTTATSLAAIEGYAAMVKLLIEKGADLNSLAFAKKIEHWRDNLNLELSLVIGGAGGLSKEIKNKAHHSISFGKMVWPHRLIRVMIAEQLYRAASIISGSPYHKA